MSETAKKLTPAELEERLRPKHLAPDTTIDDLKAKVAEQTQGPEPQTAATDIEKDPRAQNPYTFDFSWRDARGKLWEGRFQTHMPTPMDLMRAGVMQARLLGSTPKESLDAFTDEIAYMVSRLSFVLDTRPDWFANPIGLVDGVPLIQAVYEEVASYEAFFRQHGKA